MPLEPTTWEDVGEKLRAAGCGSHTIWAEWGFNCDLSKLRRHLSAAGYSDVAPAEGMGRYSLLKLWRKIFPQCFSFDLDILFPFLFPRYRLIGRKHHSNVDAEQTVLILQITVQLLKLPEDRNMRFLTQSTFSKWAQSTGNTRTQSNELYELALGQGTESLGHRAYNMNQKKRHHEDSKTNERLCKYNYTVDLLSSMFR